MINIITKNFVLKQNIRCIQLLRNYSVLRNYSSASNAPVNEKLIMEKLKLRFPNAININVEDTSGGCGAMFNVSVETTEFKGLTIMKQHRIVYEALKDEMPKLHGLHLETRTTK